MISRRISGKKNSIEVFAQVNLIGNDLLVVLWGGTKPHIGAIGIGQPSKSLKDSKKISATSSVFTFVGHKEDTVAKWMSEELARGLNKTVVVSCGMHWDGLTDERINQILRVCRNLAGRIMKMVKEEGAKSR